MAIKNKMIQSVFNPAISLMNRFGYTKKFSLLWFLSMIAIAVVIYNLFVSLDRVIQPSQRELDGLVLIEPIARTIQTIQLHRGISAGLLGGNEAMRERRAVQEDVAADTFREMEKKLPANLISSDYFRKIRADWGELRHSGLTLEMDDNFARHTKLIEQLQSFEIFVSDEYLLTLDPEIASFYLIDTAINKLPHAIEHLGQIRAYGTGVLTRKQISEHQRTTLIVQIAELYTTLNELHKNLDKTGRYNDSVRDSLLVTSSEIDRSVQQISDLTKNDILTERFNTAPEIFLDTATTEIDNSYIQMYDSLLPTVESLIRIRIANAKRTLLISTGIALFIFMLVVYLSVSIYYATINSIHSLTHSARAFAEGNLNMRARLDTRDELSVIADSFNEMADGFNAILAERIQAEQALTENQNKLNTIIETALDAVVQMDADGIITDWNYCAENTFGWSREEAIGRTLGETIIPQQYRDAHAQGLKRFLASGESSLLGSRVELMGLHRDGHEFPIELSITSINVSGKYEFNGFIRDITQKKKSEELIWKQANFDALTGLPNRHMFHDRLAQDIKKACRTNLKIALLFIDLDKFKEVNDTLGHSTGDVLLKEAAQRINGCVRDTDTVARLGGDEFIVILPELDDDTSNLERIAENILQNLVRPFCLDKDMIYVSASIGITLYPVDATKAEDLLKNADQAMYAAKNKGRNRFSYFMPSMQQAAQERLHMNSLLHGALAARQFTIFYQPIVDMSTGRITKAEALIRWQHPELGMINPAQFIPLAEETGLIIEIGDWVFRETARQLNDWRTEYNTDLQVSVNVSPVQFRNVIDNSSHQSWFEYLQEIKLPEQSIVIEITEGLLLDADTSITTRLLEFRDAGIETAIDDFGTGYSSLSYLKKFDIDYLKIDQSFVRNLVTDPNDMALSEAIIVMAHKLGLKVIAEGVETEAQYQRLAEAGCDFAQGYLLSRPVPTEKFEELLKKQQLGTQKAI